MHKKSNSLQIAKKYKSVQHISKLKLKYITLIFLTQMKNEKKCSIYNIYSLNVVNRKAATEFKVAKFFYPQ